MFTPYVSNYGLGIIKAKNKDKIVSHLGCILGYISYVLRYINKKYVIIVLSNDESTVKTLYSIVPSLLRIVEDNNNIL